MNKIVKSIAMTCALFLGVPVCGMFDLSPSVRQAEELFYATCGIYQDFLAFNASVKKYNKNPSHAKLYAMNSRLNDLKTKIAIISAHGVTGFEDAYNVARGGFVDDATLLHVAVLEYKILYDLCWGAFSFVIPDSAADHLITLGRSIEKLQSKEDGE